MAEELGFIVPLSQDYIARQMNKTFSFRNNSIFYAFLPTAYRDYYMQVVKTSLEWLDGYVWGFHSAVNGIFSMQLCPSLIKGLAQSIKGGKMLFEKTGANSDKSVEFLTHKWQDSNFDEAILQAITCSMAGACVALKTNISNKGLWVEAVRQDNFYFNCDSKGKVYDAKFFIKNFVCEIQRDDEKEERNYYLVEHRYFKVIESDYIIKSNQNGKSIQFKKGQLAPMVSYEIFAYFGTANNNTMAFNGYTKTNIDWEQLPKQVRNMIKDDYSFLKVGKCEPLPYSDWLGVELLKYGGKDVTITTATMGNSLISQLSQYFMFYDYAWSLRARDLYLGKGSVLLPKQFTLDSQVMGGGIELGEGVVQTPNTQFKGVMDKTMYETYDSNDPQANSPKSVQFDYRIEETTKLLDDIVKKCATMIGVSPKMFASYLSQGTAQKTATEVDAEDDISIAYISFQRECFEKPINRLIKKICLYYCLDTEVKCKFSTPSLVNKDKIQKRVLEQLQVGIIDLEEAIRQLYPDKDENAIKGMVEKAKLQQKDNDRRKAVFVSTSGDYGF